MIASLERLLAHLDMAHDDLVQGQELGKLDAILAVVQYLKDAGASPSQLLPLGALANDLYRPKVGNQKPLLASIREAVAAAAVDVLKDGGMSLADALGLVSEATGGALDQTQLGDLRENLRRTKKRSEARQKYDEAKNGFTKFRRDNAEAPESAWRDAVLAVVKKRYGGRKP